MNEHPDHLLAELVDGDLAAADRAAVEDHVAGCARCRDEVRLARDARGALSTLRDLSPPPGLELAVRREMRAPRRSWRAAGIAAVAAGVIAAGAVAVSVVSDRGGGVRGDLAEEPQGQAGDPAGGGDSGGGQGSAPESAGGTATDSALSRKSITPNYRDTDRRYTQRSLPRLGRRFRAEAADALAAGFPPTATAFYREFELSELGPGARAAYRCVLAEVPPTQPVAPLAVEGAVFDGQPAYVAAFLEGPAPDQPYSRVVIWVVGREGCSLLSLAGQALE